MKTNVCVHGAHSTCATLPLRQMPNVFTEFQIIKKKLRKKCTESQTNQPVSQTNELKTYPSHDGCGHILSIGQTHIHTLTKKRETKSFCQKKKENRKNTKRNEREKFEQNKEELKR